MNAWVEPRVVEQLDAKAAAAVRSRSAEVGIALCAHVERDDEHEEEDGA